MSDDHLEFLKSASKGFGKIDASADALHGMPENKHYSTTETIWFELLLPEFGIVGHFYIYMRPNLGICASGAWFWQGFVKSPLQMDHFNYQAALPMPLVDGNVVYVPQVGLKVTILEPLKRLKIEYENGTTRANLIGEAAMQPAMRSSEKHFNQFMHYTGELLLNGKAYPIDTLSMRDRSWHEPRVEDSLLAPVTTWASGMTLDRQSAFNFVGHDDPALGVEWEGVYDISSAKALYDGWYYNNGELLKIVEMSKRTQRDPYDRMAPQHVEVDFTDAAGRRHNVVGVPKASGSMSNWPNIHVWLPLMDWTLDGKKAQGDCQEYCWSDYARRFWK